MLALLGLSACGAPPAQTEQSPVQAAPGLAQESAPGSAQESTPEAPQQPALKAPTRTTKLPPELRAAGEGPAAALVASEVAKAKTDERTLVVYVGAPWCEPCVAFHEALVAGEVATELAGARFLEFNMDVDQERLALAGYTSRLIPLFVLPEADGHAGSRRIEGGIKGPGAVANLSGRLRPLLAE